jgi:hypothetical protein
LTYDVPLGLCFASAVFSFLPVSGMGLVNPEGYIALSLFPHLSVLSLTAVLESSYLLRCVANHSHAALLDAWKSLT